MSQTETTDSSKEQPTYAPSMLHGYAEELTGTIVEKIGHVIHSPQMESEGQTMKHEAELEISNIKETRAKIEGESPEKGSYEDVFF